MIEVKNIQQIIKGTISTFKRNKVRTFLTSLGITIGVMSVVLLIALGLGLKNYIKEQFENLGSNILFVKGGSSISEGGFSNSFGGFLGGTRFDERDVASLRKVSDVDYIVPMSYTSAVIKTENTEEIGSVMGATEDIFPLMNLNAEAGEFFSKTDSTKGTKIAVLGNTLADNLFDDPSDGLGKSIQIQDQRFKVVAVAEKLGDPDTDSGVIIPYKSAFGKINPTQDFIFVYLGVDNKDNVEQVKKDAEEQLLKRYSEDEFSISEQEELLSTINTIFGVINGILVAIGSISLLVGGVGIMNIMYATVTERIKEIGIRRAVGATEKDILFQFLIESVTLSLMGGLLGLFLSSLIVFAVRPFFPVSLNLLAIFVAVGVSSAIGIFFGVFPARKASQLPPIEAIRYE